MSTRTQKEINQEIKALEARIDDIQNIRKYRIEIVKLETRIREIKNEYQEEIKTSVDCWGSDIQALKKELKNKKEDNKLQISERVKRWFSNYKSGIGWGYKEPTIVWISEDERFVIITDPGGTAGTGTPMGSGGYYYASSTHWLTETIEGSTYLGRSTMTSKAAPKWLEHEGRLTKEVKQKMIDYSEELKKQNN